MRRRSPCSTILASTSNDGLAWPFSISLMNLADVRARRALLTRSSPIRYACAVNARPGERCGVASTPELTQNRAQARDMRDARGVECAACGQSGRTGSGVLLQLVNEIGAIGRESDRCGSLLDHQHGVGPTGRETEESRMTKRKTPYLQQGGTTEAERFAGKAIDELGNDPEALSVLVALVELMAKRSRSSRRRD
jgi:hypothetical protein